MSEYNSPIRNSQSGSNDPSNNSHMSDQYISFVTTPSPGIEPDYNNWNNRSHPRRNQHRYNPNNFRHSTPQHRGRNVMYNRPNNSSPFNRGPRSNNFEKDTKLNAADYFHPSMLENPWAELEKKYEKSIALENASQKKTENSCSSSDSDSESDQ